MTRTPVRSATGHVASVVLMLIVGATVLTGCGVAEGAAPVPIAGPAIELTTHDLFAELAEIECTAHESGVYNQNEIWGEYSTVAGRYEQTGLIDETEIEVPGAGGGITTVSLRTVLTSEDELKQYASVGEGVTTVRDEVGQEEYDLQTSLFCTVFTNDGVIPETFATANGLNR
jgi:hypothetical protein